MDLTEAEDIKKRCQECTEDLQKKDLHDQDDHDGVITHIYLGRIQNSVTPYKKNYVVGKQGNQDLGNTTSCCSHRTLVTQEQFEAGEPAHGHWSQWTLKSQLTIARASS